MEITRSRTLRFRMGEYESFETSASITRSFPDDADSYDTASVMNELLSIVMQDDIEDAAALSGDRKSFIHRITNQKDS